VEIEGLFVFISFHISTHFIVDPILFPEEQSSKKETVECQPGTSEEDNAEDQVPKPIRYMYCKIMNDCMTRELLARYQLSLYLHILVYLSVDLSLHLSVCPFSHLLLNILTSPSFAYLIIRSFT